MAREVERREARKRGGEGFSRDACCGIVAVWREVLGRMGCGRSSGFLADVLEVGPQCLRGHRGGLTRRRQRGVADANMPIDRERGGGREKGVWFEPQRRESWLVSGQKV